MNAQSRKNLFLVFTFGLIFFFSQSISAEQLPVKTYTIADGLARDYIYRIKQDSHGLMWFCTAEGISRFDGYGFKNYGVADGLPHRIITDFLETRNGDYLFGTSNGLVQFNPNGADENGSYFNEILLDKDESSKAIAKVIEDKNGVIWVGTAIGLYRLNKTDTGWQAEFVEINLDLDKPFVYGGINTILVDNQNSLWIGTGDAGIYRRLPNGKIEHYTEKNGLSQNGISDIFQDRDGKIWVGTGTGLTLLVDNPQPNQNIAARIYTTKDGLLHDFIETIFQSSDGRLWIGSRGGLNYLTNPKDNNGLAFRGYSQVNGLPNVRLLTITEDKDNNLWFGGENGGAKKLPLVGFTSYFETDGLGTARIGQVFADQNENNYVLSVNPNTLLPLIVRFDGQGFIDETPGFPPKTQLTWGWNQLVTQDKEGDFWVGTEKGIFRFAVNKSSKNLSNLSLKKLYTTEDGMDDNNIFRLFEDLQGNIWFSTLGPKSKKSLHYWDRKSDKIIPLSLQDYGIRVSSATAFANDPDGNLWLGFYTGGIAIYRNGTFKFWGEADGVPKGFIRHLFFDSKKRLWVATSLGGVARIDNWSADKPEFINYTVKDGLSSDQVTTVTEDKWGRIYLGTGRGIDRFDAETKRIKHFTTTDGLSDNFINVSRTDSQGVLWFGNLRGLSRFVPQEDKPHSAPSILISNLKVAGIKQPISAFGQSEVTIPELSYTQNQLEIDFLSVSYASGDLLRYQYKFEDSNSDWSEPSEKRTITLPNLPSGNYRFLVRAINSDGQSSENPAVVSFKILPPIWLRWWFITIGVLLFAGLATGFFLYRTARLQEVNKALEEARFAEENLRKSQEERLAELEKVRSRIATDLHDDIGASLTQIAILSEVAQAQIKGNGATDSLTKITNVSNELVGTMSDIVWSINPSKDHLSDLTQRMRRFASDSLSAKGIIFHFNLSEANKNIVINSNIKREMFLIFKESINNIVKHSGAKQVEIELKIENRNLILQIKDNGNGFEIVPSFKDSLSSISMGGNGILSMQKRAEEMNGELEIISEISQGTIINLRLPLEQNVV